MCSLVNISGNDSPIGKKNLEFNNKRKLPESDNYIIIQFSEEVGFDTKLLNKSLINYIKNKDEIINNTDGTFTVQADTKLEIHFKGVITDMKNFFDTDKAEFFKKMISVDFSQFDASNIINMNTMFYGCSALQSLDLSNFDTSKAITMDGMFYGCSALQSLDLSNFDTSNVKFMNSMFYGCSALQSLDLSYFNTTLTNSFYYMFQKCTSLKYLILSNFNFDKLYDGQEKGVTNMFSGLEKLEYIDIYNIKDSNSILKVEITGNAGLNNKDNLIVCQNNDFITNPNAIYKCCKITGNNLDCNNIQTTITTIETTISQIWTTNPFIETTNPLLETTIPIFQSTVPNIETTNPIESTFSQIQTSIPKLETTFPNTDTNLPQIQTTNPNIETTNPQIQTTIPTIKTTIPQIQTTIPKFINIGATLILMGFNSFNIISSIMSFYIYFVPIINNVYSSLIKVPLIINYNTRIRILEEEEIECQLKETNNKGITSYYCEKELKNLNVTQVKIIPNFNFTYQDNVTIIGFTPFAKMYMNNLQDLDNKYDNLQNSTIYILNNSFYNKYSTNLYNITGIMNPKPISNLENKNIDLMINLESESKIKTESRCTIIKINESNYTLNCKYNENIKGDLQGAISFIDEDEILLVNFDGGNNNTIITKNPTTRKYISKKSNGLKPGAIVAIVLALAFALAAVIGVAICMKNKNISNVNKTEKGSESIIQILK